MTHYVDKPCQHCGKMMCGVILRVKYHPECYEEIKREVTREYNRTHHKEINERQRERKAIERQNDPPNRCQICGVLIVGRKRKFCPECAMARAGGNRCIRAGKPKVPRKKPLRHCWDLSFKSATQVQVEARALGLTYGKYSMLIDTLMIERYLANEGITDGLDRIDKAWRDFKREKKAQAEADKKRTAEYWEEVNELHQL